MMHKCSNKLCHMTKKLRGFLGYSDKDGNLFGVKESSTHKMLCRFLSIQKVCFILMGILLIFLTIISPIGGFAIKRYIMKNPTVMINSLQEMDRNEREKNDVEAKDAAIGLYKEIINDKSAAFIGNKNGKKVIIELYDYACGYCKQASEEIKKVISKDKDVKVILLDYPILSMNSLLAAKASIFVAKEYSSKFNDFHFALLGLKEINADTIKKLGEKMGIPGNKLSDIMTNNTYEPQLRANYEKGAKLRANGTPVFIINEKLLIGYISQEQIESALNS